MPIINNLPEDKRQQNALRTLNRRIAYQLGKIAEHDKSVNKLYNEVNQAGFYQGVEVHSIQEQDRKGNPIPYKIYPNKAQPLGLMGTLLGRLGHGAAMPLGSQYEDALTQDVRRLGNKPPTSLDKMVEWRQKARQLFYRNPQVKSVAVDDKLTGKQQMNNLFGILQRVNELTLDRRGQPNTLVPVKGKNNMYTETATLTPKGQAGFNALRQFNQYLNVLKKTGHYDVLAGAYAMGDDVAEQVKALHKRSAHEVLLPQDESLGKLKPFFSRLRQYKNGEATLDTPTSGFWKRLLPTKQRLITSKQEAILNPATGFAYAIQQQPGNELCQQKSLENPVTNNAYLSPYDASEKLLNHILLPAKQGFSSKVKDDKNLKKRKNKIHGLTKAFMQENEHSINTLIDKVTNYLSSGFMKLYQNQGNAYAEIVLENHTKQLLVNHARAAALKVAEKSGRIARKFSDNELLDQALVNFSTAPYVVEVIKKANGRLPDTRTDGTWDPDSKYNQELLKRLNH
jgi:hypothetical protein